MDYSYLKLTKAPLVVSSVIAERAYPASLCVGLKAENFTKCMDKADELKNVTGVSSARKVTKNGFRVRLRYNSADGRNLTTSPARLGHWRVRWMAVPYENIRQPAPADASEEDLPLDEATAYAIVLQELLKENAAVVKPLMSNKYVKPDKRWGKKVEAKKAETKKEKDGEGEEQRNTSAASESGGDPDADAPKGDDDDDNVEESEL